MHINPDAPGNISQKGVNSEADNETGFDKLNQGHDKPGFDPESPDVSDPAVDPLHPARTSNDPVPSGNRNGEHD